MALLGTIEPFNMNEPLKWKTYLERFQFFLSANGITDESKKKAVFLSICGPATYDIIHSLIAPQAVSDVDLQSITDKLSVHFLPRTSKVVARFMFHRRNQKPEENIASYIKELRRLSGDCGFDDTILEEMLRDRIVCGVREENLQRRLLAEPNLTFNKAQEMTIAYETAMQSVSTLRELPDQTANSVKGYPKKFGKQKPCFRCGNLHVPEDCPFREAVCNFCNKKGHIQRACLSKKKNGVGKKKQTANQRTVNATTEQTQKLSVESEKESEDPCYNVLSIRTPVNTENFIVPVKINGTNVNLEVDSGSAYTIVGLSP